MGSGYCAVCTTCISDENLDGIVDNKLMELKVMLVKYGVTMEDMYFFTEYEESLPISSVKTKSKEYDEIEEEMDDLYDDIQRIFREKTGLGVALNFHDSDSRGDSCDDIDGDFWELDGVYAFTPEALALGNKLEIINFVQWG